MSTPLFHPDSMATHWQAKRILAKIRNPDLDKTHNQEKHWLKDCLYDVYGPADTLRVIQGYLAAVKGQGPAGWDREDEPTWEGLGSWVEMEVGNMETDAEKVRVALATSRALALEQEETEIIMGELA